ncbi:beta-lactamase superfamily domain-containing protein [Ilyonectria destructans]|nr:beta-lactamase superfamily domain-containing protein [Ilyonectria destructans]
MAEALASPAVSSASDDTLARTSSHISSTYQTFVSKLPGLTNAPAEAASTPHHVTSKNGTIVKFQNPYPSWAGTIERSTAIREILWPLITGKLKYPDVTPPTVTVTKPEWLPPNKKPAALRATWLGHACYYVEFPSGLRVLFDPVFEDRCSPFSFIGPKRFTEKPCDIADIPIVDAVAISHSHYDHLSHDSVLEIQKRHPGAEFFVGLGLEKWLKSAGLKNVTELDWWQDAELSVVRKDAGEKGQAEEEKITAKVSCLPCQHSSARGIFDTDTTLWCSWAFRSGSKSVWFGGDTGYRAVPKDLAAGTDDYGAEYESLPRCPQFKQIGTYRGPFDLGLIPIGAYYPRTLCSSVHANPFDAVEIFQDTRCKRAMGIHWGTWALTLEEVLEPPLLLKEALKRKGLDEVGVFDVCQIGESRNF